MRSPSQLRQFFDSSALMTNLNESILLDKSLTMQKQASNRSNNMSPETYTPDQAATLESLTADQ